MKKILAVAIFSLLSLNALTVFSQAGPIRGEISPGNYVNIKSDAAGNLYVSPATGVASTYAYTQTTPTVTSATTNILSANTSRKFVSIQNNDSSGILYVNFGTSATTANFKISAGGTLILDTAVSTQQINAIGSIASNANISVIEGQ